MEQKYLFKTMRKWYVYHMPKLGRGKRRRTHRIWPGRHAPSHLSTHSADTGLHRRHAMNMTRYQTQASAPPGLWEGKKALQDTTLIKCYETSEPLSISWNLNFGGRRWPILKFSSSRFRNTHHFIFRNKKQSFDPMILYQQDDFLQVSLQIWREILVYM